MTPPEHHILVVDDDDRIRDLVRRFLAREGHRVSVAADASEARSLFASLDFDLAVLDIMMPEEDGLSLLTWLRARRRTPVILLTALGLPADRISGLRAGADDYLVKPFEPEELALRVGAILRREGASPRRTASPAEPVRLSGLTFDAERGELTGEDRRVRLTEAEAQLLSVLAARQGEPVSRLELAELTASGAERAIDVQVTRLRRKIEPDPREPRHLQTVRGIGYRLLTD
jgi:two-component system phosphate regulon response regulator OmpR